MLYILDSQQAQISQDQGILLVGVCVCVCVCVFPFVCTYRPTQLPLFRSQ